MVAIAIFDLLQILTMHTDGKILGIINNVKCCFLHDDAFLQRVKKTFLLTGIHLYLGTEQKRMDEDKSMQWGTWDRELCNLVLYSVRGNVICYKNNCKPRHVTIVGSQVWAVSEERLEKCGEWTERPCDPSHSEADIGQQGGGGGPHGPAGH